MRMMKSFLMPDEQFMPPLELAWRRSECTYMEHTSPDEVYNATWGRSMMNGTIRPSDPLPMYDPRKDHNKYPA